MKDLKKLRAQLASLKAQGKSKTDEYNALAAKLAGLEGEAKSEAEAKLAALDTELEALASQVETLAGEIDAEEKKARRAAVFQGPTAHTPARTLNEPNPATTAGFHNLAEFAIAVARTAPQAGGVIDQRLLAAPANFHQNQGGAGEGFLVPTEFRNQIWELVFADSDLLGLCNPEPTSSNAISIPKDETTPWGASGVQASWRAEAGQMSASKVALTGSIMQLHELYAFVLATSELLEDAPRLNSRLTMQAARAIRWKASDAVVWGDGNGKPLGFMNAGCLVTVAKEGGQAADTLNNANILKMYSRLLRQGGSPIWLANSDVLPQLGQLTLGNQPAWLPSNAPLQGSPDGTLLGRPLQFNEHMKTLGDLGDIALVDLSGYALATKAGGGIDFAASIHLYFDYNIQAFRWTFRVGGQPYLSAAVSPANGSNTKSHFVTLQAR